MARSPAAEALETAARLDAWLACDPLPPGAGEPARPNVGTDAGSGASGRAGEGGAAPSRMPPDASPRRAPAPEVLAPAHTDWLYHHLKVVGPAEDLTRFRAAAAGTGVVPWSVDWDRLEEDWAHLLLAPPPQ